MRKPVALACLALAAIAGVAQFTSAEFTRAMSVGGNGVTVDQLSNYFSVAPISSAASGNVDSLSLSFGTVASARTLTNVFRVTNVSGATQTAVLTLSSAPQITSVVFASSGSDTATLAAGASTTVTVTTSNTVCGHGAGTLKLGITGLGWMYRTYGVTIDEAPEAPGTPTATAKPAGRLDVTWPASTTTTNLAGYDLYRSAAGGAYTKLNSSPLTGLAYSDTATVDGTSYTYEVQAVSTGSTVLTSLFDGSATALADATPPAQPTGISPANGGGAGNAYVNGGNASSLSVSVTLASGWLGTDTVKLTLSSGASSVTRTTSPSSGTVTFTGIDVSSFADGGISAGATSTDAAGNVSTATAATFVKDTVAPAAPSAVYTDKNNAADMISGSAETGATITITETAPNANTFTTTAAGGSYSANVDTVNGKANAKVTVAYTVRATDAAGNTSGATPVSFADSK
jgi:Bacterial Ig domain